MKYPGNIREEELKDRVKEDWFDKFSKGVIGNIDFALKIKRATKSDNSNGTYLLWTEAKLAPTDVAVMLTQLVLTIGKERTFDRYDVPYFLGVFDREKIAFIPYNSVQSFFYQNDFNWNVAPSNHKTREFGMVHDKVKKVLDDSKYEFDFESNEKDLRFFISTNLAKSTEEIRRAIDINNIISIYHSWLETIKPIIDFDWSGGKKRNILDRDFYLADLFVDDKNTATINDDTSVKRELHIVFKGDRYEIAKEDLKALFNATIPIKDKKAYEQFWKKYKRPPIEKYWHEILERQDRLVPQDVRERKGAFFTPRRWVKLSQQYIADVLGENWQNEYYVWDCAAGTGNLLVGLWNKDNIWASTLDQADVNVMKDQIRDGANLWENQVFQFDFLNDDFLPMSKGGKMPDGLYDIIGDPEKRKKLVVYINPPYAEGDNVRGLGRKGVQNSKIHDKYQKEIGKASGELFAQFFARIYSEIPHCVLAEFSKLKILQAPNFRDFRQHFRAKLEKFFVVPAKTFDNVNGEFPIGFFVWDTSKEEIFERTTADVYDKQGIFLGEKTIVSYDNSQYISEWLEFYSKNISKDYIGHLASVGNDFQNQRMVFIDDVNAKRKKGGRHTMISAENLIPASIYFAVRQVIPADWLNDRDQFLYPNDGWQSDAEFQNDCLAYTLFNNNIQSAQGANNWIPFTETEVGAREKFAGRFMTDFIAGKARRKQSADLFSGEAVLSEKPTALQFSSEATAVFDAGRELWHYYHTQPDCNVNASLYDIREHFQGRNNAGKMNNKSSNERYNELIGALRAALKTLAHKIEPKVYEYGFLKQ